MCIKDSTDLIISLFFSWFYVYFLLTFVHTQFLISLTLYGRRLSWVPFDANVSVQDGFGKNQSRGKYDTRDACRAFKKIMAGYSYTDILTLYM